MRMHLNSSDYAELCIKHPSSRKALKNKTIEPHNHFTENTEKYGKSQPPIIRKNKEVPPQIPENKDKFPRSDGEKGATLKKNDVLPVSFPRHWGIESFDFGWSWKYKVK